MRLRTFTATDMPAAMKMVRDALGENAIIIASESHKGRKAITVTAAADQQDDAPIAAAPPRTSKEIDQLRFELQNILRFHNIPELFVAKMMQKAADKDIAAIISLHKITANRDARQLYTLAMDKLLSSFFHFQPLNFPSPLEGKSSRIMLVGTPGIGKTLTIAKLAARLAMDKNPVAVVTTDDKRAGGVEQLQAFTSILGLDLEVAASRAELEAYASSLPKNTHLLVDTAGCNPYEPAQLRELETFASLKGIEPVLVMQAGGDSLEAVDIVEAFTLMPIKRLLITRADTAKRFGGVIAAASAHELSFCNASGSSSIKDALQPIDSVLLAQLLLRYQLQTK
jgi:flagellar biosynthesis protein FlhF